MEAQHNSAKAPKWILILFFAPLVFAALARLLDLMFKKAVWRWQQLSDVKQRNAMLALIKGVTYTVTLGLSIPVMVHVMASWGQVPTWVQDDTLSTLFNIAAGQPRFICLS